MNEVAVSMICIGIIYFVSLCVLIPLYIYLRRNKSSLIDMRSQAVLSIIIALSILVFIFEGGISSQLPC